MSNLMDQSWGFRLAATLGIVAFLVAQPIKADEVVTDEIVKSSSTTEVSPGPAITSPEKTTVVTETVKEVIVPGVTVSSTVYAKTLDSQRELILRIIAAGMSSGKLSIDDANRLRAKLDAIAAQEEAARASGGLTYARSIIVARDLDLLAADLNNLLPLSPVVPLITGSHFTLLGNQIVTVDDIAFRRGQLEFWISDSLATGKITEESAARLRAQMDQIAAVESRYRAAGDLNVAESRDLYQAFDKVGSDLDRAKARDMHASIGVH